MPLILYKRWTPREYRQVVNFLWTVVFLVLAFIIAMWMNWP